MGGFLLDSKSGYGVCALRGGATLLLISNGDESSSLVLGALRGGVLCTLHLASDMALFITFIGTSRSGDLSLRLGGGVALSSSSIRDPSCLSSLYEILARLRRVRLSLRLGAIVGLLPVEI